MIVFFILILLLLARIVDLFVTHPYFIKSKVLHHLDTPLNAVGYGGRSPPLSLEEYSRLGKRLTDVGIQSPSLNTRKITASIMIDSPTENVWDILTDYNNLATHVPNLVKSYLIPNPTRKILLFQEGAQKIIGFDFRASLTMEMKEERGVQTPSGDFSSSNDSNLSFKLIESRMFDAFDGQWSLRSFNRATEFDAITKQPIFRPKTKLTYSVFVRPRGPVPVLALEWRIREDIPMNLYAVKIAAEKLGATRALSTAAIAAAAGSDRPF